MEESNAHYVDGVLRTADIDTTNSAFQGCGCRCDGCDDNTSLHLHIEIENLQQRLHEKEHHIVKMETNFLAEADKYPDGEVVAMMEEVAIWQDKYNRYDVLF